LVVYKNGKYAIGTVTEYSLGSGSAIAPSIVSQPGNLPYVKYRFIIEGN
jgi:hypothetical protein